MSAPTATGKKLSRKTLLIFAGAVIGICFICAIGASLSKDRSPSKTAAPIDPTVVQQTAISIVYQNFTQTAAAQPTATLLPTDTPVPTNTVVPTATQSPIMLSGQGDSVVDIEKWEGPAILKINHTGGRNFAIWNDDASGEHIDLLVNTIGNYQGTVPLDFMKREHTTRFEITAGGQWSLQVLPLMMVRKENIPGTIQSIGDDVIALVTSDSPDLLKADASQASRNFVIHTYGDSGRDLVVNEIAPYTGIVAIDRNTFLIVVKATGPWSVEITAK